MACESFLTDTVTLIKQDGKIVEGIKASVQSKKIFIFDNQPLIESGDLIQRKMSNGAEETYKVIDPGFHEKAHGIPAHYQMNVHKFGVPEAKSASKSITYNVTGNNARINQNSVDQSVNVVHLSSDVAEKLNALRQEINEFIKDESRRSEALEIVDTIEDQFKSGSPKQAVVSALIKSLPSAGNIASIGSFLLSCLS